MNALSRYAGIEGRAVRTPRLSVVLTAAFAVLTIGVTVIVFAAFVALMFGGGGGAHALFALIAGSLAYTVLVFLQFLQWAAMLLARLRSGQ